MRPYACTPSPRRSASLPCARARADTPSSTVIFRRRFFFVASFFSSACSQECGSVDRVRCANKRGETCLAVARPWPRATLDASRRSFVRFVRLARTSECQRSGGGYEPTRLLAVAVTYSQSVWWRGACLPPTRFCLVLSISFPFSLSGVSSRVREKSPSPPSPALALSSLSQGSPSEKRIRYGEETWGEGYYCE